MSIQSSPLVSVVVPIYNVERYLDACIESVMGQTYLNLEVILVDDGATDSCPEKCDAWAARDGRIKVVHKQNQGLGMARNSGLEAASGKYVCFFDSDDYVDANAIECLVSHAERTGADVVMSGIRRVFDDGTVLNEYVPCCPKESYEGREVQSEFLPFLVALDPRTGEDWGLMASACCSFYRLAALEKCGFRFASERDIISEDVYSILGLFGYIQKATFIPRIFYNYRVNQTSLTHTFNPQRLSRIAHFYRVSRELAYKRGYDDEVMKRLAVPYLNFVIAALKQLAVADVTRSEKLVQVAEVSRSKEFRSAYSTLKGARLGLKKKFVLKAVAWNCGNLVLVACSAQASRG